MMNLKDHVADSNTEIRNRMKIMREYLARDEPERVVAGRFDNLEVSGELSAIF